MLGITTALVVYMLACIAIPKLVKNRPQFYIAFFAILAIILLDALRAMIPSEGFHAVVYVFTAGLQIISLVLMLMSTGGQTLGELGSALGHAVDVFRNGAEPEPPYKPTQPMPTPIKPTAPTPRKHQPGDPDARRIYAIDETGEDQEIDPDSGVIPATPAEPPKKSDDGDKSGGIPLA